MKKLIIILLLTGCSSVHHVKPIEQVKQPVSKSTTQTIMDFFEKRD